MCVIHQATSLNPYAAALHNLGKVVVLWSVRWSLDLYYFQLNPSPLQRNKPLVVCALLLCHSCCLCTLRRSREGIPVTKSLLSAQSPPTSRPGRECNEPTSQYSLTLSPITPPTPQHNCPLLHQQQHSTQCSHRWKDFPSTKVQKE